MTQRNGTPATEPFWFLGSIVAAADAYRLRVAGPPPTA
jgi:hypothetical protein